MPAPKRIELTGLQTLPGVRPGDDLARLIYEAVRREQVELAKGDVVVVAQKIVSKAENRLIRLRDVQPSSLARNWARRLGADARLIEVVLQESRRVVRMSERVLITETRHGFVCANAGVDRSNMPRQGWVSCLPLDPDKSARRISAGLRKRMRLSLPVVITDSFGRPWREGLTNVAIGAAGLRVLKDLRGRKDAHGRRLRATVLAVADELATAAGLLMGKADRVPVVVVRGYRYRAGTDSARRLIRPAAHDLFR